MMVRNDNGRYLMVHVHAFSRYEPRWIKVVRGHEINDYVRSGWIVIAEDPEPNRYDAPGDDGA